jgi:hypothetical protein
MIYPPFYPLLGDRFYPARLAKMYFNSDAVSIQSRYTGKRMLQCV